MSLKSLLRGPPLRTVRLGSRPRTHRRLPAWLPLLCASLGRWKSPALGVGGRERAPGRHLPVAVTAAASLGEAEPDHGEVLSGLVLTRAPHFTVTVVTGKSAQGLLSRFFLELLSAFWPHQPGLIRNRTEAEHSIFVHVLRAGVILHLGPESPDVSSFIPTGGGPVASGEDRGNWALGVNVSPEVTSSPDGHTAAVLGRRLPSAAGMSEPQAGQACL